MPKATQHHRSVNNPRTRAITAADDWTGPIVKRELEKRKVPIAKNPYAGLTEGAEQIGNRMVHFGNQMAQFFGSMSDSMVKMAGTAAAVEAAEKEEQDKQLKLQAHLDHANGSPYSSDAKAYTFERQQLETTAAARRAQSLHRAVSGGSSGRRRSGGSSGGTGAASKKDVAMARQQAEDGLRIQANAKAVDDAESPFEAPPQTDGNTASVSGASVEELTNTPLLDPSQPFVPPVTSKSAMSPTQAAIKGTQPVDPAYLQPTKKSGQMNQMLASRLADEVATGFKAEVLPTLDASQDVMSMYGRLDQYVAQKLEGADPTIVGQIGYKVQQLVDDSIRTKRLSIQSNWMKEQQTAGENAVFSIVSQGGPFTAADLESHVKSATAFYKDDERQARQAITKAAAHAYIERVKSGDVDAYARGIATLSPMFEAFPAETYTLRNQLDAAHEHAVKSRIGDAATALDEATAAGDPDKVVQLLVEHADKRNHPSFRAAANRAQKMIDGVVEERTANTNFDAFLRKEYIPTADDTKKFNEIADQRFHQYLSSGDTVNASRLIASIGSATSSSKLFLNRALSNVSAKDALVTKGADGNEVPTDAYRQFQAAFEVVSKLPDNVRAKVLDPEAEAVYDLVGGPGADVSAAMKDRVTNALRVIEKNSGKIAKGEINHDLKALYGTTKVDEAEAKLLADVTSAAGAPLGTLDSVTVTNPDAFVRAARARMMEVSTLTGGRITDNTKAQIIKGVVSSALPLPVGDGWVSNAYELTQVPFAVRARWDDYQGALSKFKDGASKLRETSGFLPASIGLSGSAPQLEEHRQAGWLQATSLDEYGLPIKLSPGREVQIGQNLLAPGKQKLAEQHADWLPDGRLPADRVEFEKSIATLNGKLAKTGFQFLPEPGSQDVYLAFRPVADAELADEAKLASAAGQHFGRGEHIVENAKLLMGVAQQGHLNDIAQQAVKRLQDEGLVPKSLGLTVPIPEFQNAEEFTSWLDRAAETYRINYEGARPRPDDPSVPMEKHLFDYVSSIHPVQETGRRVIGDERRVIGAGLDLDADWVRQSLTDLGYDAKKIADIREGRAQLNPGDAEALTVAGVRRAEGVIRKNVDVRKLPSLPADAYKVLVQVTYDHPKFMNKAVAEAFDRGDWSSIAEAITKEVPSKGPKSYRNYVRFLRRSQANVFARSLGASTIPLE